MTPQEQTLARDIYVALIGNTERYKFVKALVKAKKLTEEEATEKTRAKSVLLAKYFYANRELKK